MSVNIDNDVVDVISCAALFYEKGKSGNSFLRNEKFQTQLPRNEKTLKSVRETVRGVREVAKNIGLGSHIEVKLARLDKSDQNKGPQCFAINTDAQVSLELTTLRTGADTLQRKVKKNWPAVSWFTESLGKVHLKHNKKTILWTWKIKCGICRSKVQLRLDSSLKGRISHFQAHPPGPIDNSNIIVLKGNTKVLRANSEYGQLSRETWTFLHDIYDGGPGFFYEEEKDNEEEKQDPRDEEEDIQQE